MEKMEVNLFPVEITVFALIFGFLRFFAQNPGKKDFKHKKKRDKPFYLQYLQKNPPIS